MNKIVCPSCGATADSEKLNLVEYVPRYITVTGEKDGAPVLDGNYDYDDSSTLAGATHMICRARLAAPVFVCGTVWKLSPEQLAAATHRDE